MWGIGGWYEGGEGGEDDSTKDWVLRWILTGHRQGMFSKYGSQACNFCVNEAFFFWVGGSTSSRSKMRQMMLESVNQMLLTGKVNVQWQRYWKLVQLWRAKCSSVLMNETCFPHRNQSQLMEASCGGVMRVQHVRKWCIEFENGRTGIRDTNRTSQPGPSRTAVNAARVTLILGLCLASLGRSPFTQ